MIRAVFFDLGNTLIHYPRISTWHAFREGSTTTWQWLGAAGFTCPPLWKYREACALQVTMALVNSWVHGRDFTAIPYLRRAAENLRLSLTEEQLVEWAWQWYTPLHVASAVAPDARDTLERLARRPLILGLVSNTFITGQVLDRHLAELGLLEWLPHRLYSGETPFKKPDRRLFHAMMDKAGVSGADSLFVGDNPRADIRGAAGAGMKTVWKVPASRAAQLQGRKKLADFIIHELSELPAIVESLDAGSRSAR